MVFVEDVSSLSEDEVEIILNDDLFCGFEWDVIEFYFYRGFMYRYIILMLEK